LGQFDVHVSIVTFGTGIDADLQYQGALDAIPQELPEIVTQDETGVGSGCFKRLSDLSGK
jgi:hypothetical protein